MEEPQPAGPATADSLSKTQDGRRDAAGAPEEPGAAEDPGPGKQKAGAEQFLKPPGVTTAKKNKVDSPAALRRSRGSPNVRSSPLGCRPKQTSPWRSSPRKELAPFTLSPCQSLSPQRKRRSWRRSSLKGTKRRQSLPPIHQDITGLSKSISLGLPEPDRLSALLLSSFQFSVQKLQQILQGDSSFKPEAFQAQAQSVSEELKHHLQKLQQDGTLRGCTEDPSGQPPPPELEKSVAQVKDFIARFSAECQAWDQLLLGYQQGSEEAARRLEQSRSSAKQAEPVPHLQTSQAQVLRSKPDYRQILQEQGQVLSCMELLLDELQQALKLLGAFSEESQQVLQRLSRRLAARTFQQLEGSPARRLLVAPPKKGPET